MHIKTHALTGYSCASHFLCFSKCQKRSRSRMAESSTSGSSIHNEFEGLLTAWQNTSQPWYVREKSQCGPHSWRIRSNGVLVCIFVSCINPAFYNYPLMKPILKALKSVYIIHHCHCIYDCARPSSWFRCQCVLSMFHDDVSCAMVVMNWKYSRTPINPLPTNDAPIRHDLCELSISLLEFIWVFKY